jgi:stress response protein SCP2
LTERSVNRRCRACGVALAEARFDGTTDRKDRHVIELTRGQEMALTTDDGRPLVRLQMGLGWDEERGAGFIGTGRPHVDLDATAVQFADGQLFDIAFYNHLETRDGSVVHLGDNISGSGEGDDERLTVDLSRVYAKVDTILFLVSSYQGHSLDWIDNAYCRLVDDHDVELARLTLTDGTPRTGLVMAKLFRVGDDWRLRAIGEGVAVTVPTESIDRLTRFL